MAQNGAHYPVPNSTVGPPLPASRQPASAILPRTDTVTPGGINGVASVSATVVRGRALSATISGVATVSATVVTTHLNPPPVVRNNPYVPTYRVLGSRTYLPIPPPPKVISGSSSGVAAVSATVVRDRALSPTINGVATVTAAVTTTASPVIPIVYRNKPYAPTFRALGTRSYLPIPLPPKIISGTSNGVATVGATVVRTRAITPSSSGVASVTATVVRVRALTASPHGVATVSAAVVRTRALLASPAGLATVTTSIVRTRALSPSPHGVASVSANVQTSSPTVVPDNNQNLALMIATWS